MKKTYLSPEIAVYPIEIERGIAVSEHIASTEIFSIITSEDLPEGWVWE